MDRPLLLIGKETFIGSKLAERLLMEGRRVITMGSDVSKNGNTILWNRLSYISAKTAIREMERQYGSAEEVFIVFGRKRDELFPSTPSSFIDDVIDSDLKSLIYMTQELYRKALEQDKELVVYFIAENLYDSKKPVSSAAGEAFRSYAQAVMNSNSAFYMAGFELDGEDDEGFLTYVLKNSFARTTKKRNSWTVYPKGLKLFGMN